MSGRATSRSEVSGEISLATGEGMRRPLKKSDAHDDLADLGVGLHESEGGRQLVEGEDLVDQGAQGAVLQLRHDVADEAAHGLAALGGIAQSIADAEHGEALAVQRFEI